jgi:two-component system chemotaxis response regulator CheB
MPVKTLIVDDSPTYRSLLGRSLRAIPQIEIIGKAPNGQVALQQIQKTTIDLVTLDVEMPVMDGLETLRQLKQLGFKGKVVMVSGLSDQARELTIQCLHLGAIDFVLKPQEDKIQDNLNTLTHTFKELVQQAFPQIGYRVEPSEEARSPVTSTGSGVPEGPPVPRSAFPGKTLQRPLMPQALIARPPALVAIGISTGGPKALGVVIDGLKAPRPFPIVVVQHMPPKFTKSLSENLNLRTSMAVKEASGGDPLQANTIYIAPGGLHLEVERANCLMLTVNKKPPVNSCRPSVDVLFFSLARQFRAGEVAALVMTGMGRDGATGAAHLTRQGIFVGVQSEASCTVFGMPRTVMEEGSYHKVFDLNDIAPFLNDLG